MNPKGVRAQLESALEVSVGRLYVPVVSPVCICKNTIGLPEVLIQLESFTDELFCSLRRLAWRQSASDHVAQVAVRQAGVRKSEIGILLQRLFVVSLLSGYCFEAEALAFNLSS